MNWKDNVSVIKGVGPKMTEYLGKLGIYTVGDLLGHFPRDFQEFKPPVPVGSAPAGELNAVRVCIVGQPTKVRHSGRRAMDITNAYAADETGKIKFTFFNMPFISKTLKRGCFYVFRGFVGGSDGNITMEQPRVYTTEQYMSLVGVLQPVYPLTKGLTGNAVQKAVRNALNELDLSDPLGEIAAAEGLVPLAVAYEDMHFPGAAELYSQARKRLVFNEFAGFLYRIRKSRKEADRTPSGYVLKPVEDTGRLIEGLPYSLTEGQLMAWRDIEADLSGEYVMSRLIQGDVGSGKTIVAILALLMVCAGGYQGALMVPTEVLAAQHFETVSELTKEYGLPFRPVLLVGSLKASEKKKCQEKIASGDFNLIIGTHALIQEKVKYSCLALAVTDEQHRFGVRQRVALGSREGGRLPHILVMSATPIPRTLSIILYGDLDISVIRDRPAARLPIKNCVVDTSYRPTAYKFIMKQIQEGHQVYVICPKVEAGDQEMQERVMPENVMDYADSLRQVFPENINIATLHGRMKPSEKNAIMETFARGDIHILVSTTVVEVGINVPNATVILIENAERFGLAGLHQLRGRVGRGADQSYCIMIAGTDRKEALERLEILNHSNDGFHIAEEDMKLRGPGDIFGVRQSGEMGFVLGDIYNDSDILMTAKKVIDGLMDSVGSGELPELERYIDEYALGEVDFSSI